MTTGSARRIDRFEGAYWWLSNFYPSMVTDSRGFEYASVEHAYQAAKAATEAERARIASSPSAAVAKRRASKLTLAADWPERKVPVMRELLSSKFAPGSELAAKLLATGDAELVEANDWEDTFWGEYQGAGENHLGKLLMERRALLRG
ncbi:MAG: NADAR family protein [Phycisphaerales bacterium]